MRLVVSELGAVKVFRGHSLSACLTDTSLLYTEETINLQKTLVNIVLRIKCGNHLINKTD